MEKRIIKLIHSENKWFDTTCPDDPEMLMPDYDPEDTPLFFSGDFDYQLKPANINHIYIDLEMRMIPLCISASRCDFEFKGKHFSWDDIFKFDIILKLVSKAIHMAIYIFEEECKIFSVILPYKIEFDEEVAKSITKVIINDYFNRRKPHDIANKYFMNTIGVQHEQSDGSPFTVVQGTFLIIDTIIYNNPKFNRRNNRSAFTKVVPEPRYYTLKKICLEMKNHPIALTFYDTSLFYTCLDCALQMLVGDLSDILIETLESEGMDLFIRNDYIKNGTLIFNQIRTAPDQSHGKVTNLDKRYDWNTLLK